MKLRVATRKSKLALCQCRAWVASFVERHPDVVVEELQVTTTGDQIIDRPLYDVGGKGLFVKEIELALLQGEADLAVHSMKDLPPELAPGLVIGAVPPREDARDAVITRTGERLSALAPGSRLGSSSSRRRAQLAELNPQLDVVVLRGNVDTRITKCERGEVDAIMLAQAGLKRLGLSARVTEVLDPEVFLPAAGQGALAIECRGSDTALRELLADVDDEETHLCTAAERGVIAAIGGDCRTPVGAYAVRDGNELWLRGFLAHGAGTTRKQLRAPFPKGAAEARDLGKQLGNELRRQ